MTPFITEVHNEINAPVVSTTRFKLDHFAFQLAAHHLNLKLMAKGLRFKGVRFKDLKKYYGLKGRTAADCLQQFEQIENEYHNNKG